MNSASADTDMAHDCARAGLLARYLEFDDVDGAINAGLMGFDPCTRCNPMLAARLVETQRKLVAAWAARDRYQARNTRLANRAAERDARRAGAVAEKKTSLPPAAAAILMRAKARAAERDKP